jgi:pyruvate dehydrogenase E1 component
MEKPKVPYVTQATKDSPGVFVSASDYLKVLPDSIDRWLPKPLQALGTDGFGRSDSRAALRNFFEVDARFIVLSTLYGLMQEKQVAPELVAKAIKDLGIDSEKLNPAIS